MELLQAGDVELTRAWMADLATLGHQIPQFNRLEPAQEEEKSCAKKVSCWLSPKLFLKHFHLISMHHFCIFHTLSVVAYLPARCNRRTSKSDFCFKFLPALVIGMIKNSVPCWLTKFSTMHCNGRLQKIVVALLFSAFLFTFEVNLRF